MKHLCGQCLFFLRAVACEPVDNPHPHHPPVGSFYSILFQEYFKRPSGCSDNTKQSSAGGEYTSGESHCARGQLGHNSAFVEVKDRLLKPAEAQRNWNLDQTQILFVLHLE